MQYSQSSEIHLKEERGERWRSQTADLLYYDDKNKRVRLDLNMKHHRGEKNIQLNVNKLFVFRKVHSQDTFLRTKSSAETPLLLTASDKQPKRLKNSRRG